jgi:hypothetical protein
MKIYTYNTYTHIYIYIYTHTHAHIYIYIHTLAQTQIHAGDTLDTAAQKLASEHQSPEHHESRGKTGIFGGIFGQHGKKTAEVGGKEKDITAGETLDSAADALAEYLLPESKHDDDGGWENVAGGGGNSAGNFDEGFLAGKGHIGRSGQQTVEQVKERLHALTKDDD